MTASDAKPARLRFVGESDLRSSLAVLVDERDALLYFQVPPPSDLEVRIQSIRRAMREDEQWI
jgi:hypothetical protein